MLHFLKKVGANYGVIDTDDGVIEWVGEPKVKEALASGVQIVGLSGVSKPEQQKVTLSKELCNWAGGTNIFTGYTSATCSSSEFKIVANKKAFKGKYQRGAGGCALNFTFGVVVNLTDADFSAIFKK